MDQMPASAPSRITLGYIMRTALSGRDNTSVDIGRVLWAASAVLFGVLEVHSVIWLHAAFDAMQFAQASGMILIGRAPHWAPRRTASLKGGTTKPISRRTPCQSNLRSSPRWSIP